MYATSWSAFESRFGMNSREENDARNYLITMITRADMMVFARRQALWQPFDDFETALR